MTLEQIKKDKRYTVERLPYGFYSMYVACFEGRQIMVHSPLEDCNAYNSAWHSCVDHFNNRLSGR